MSNLVRSAVLAARVRPETKAQFAALAHQRAVSESNLLESLVHGLIGREVVLAGPSSCEAHQRRDDRITLRLRRGDRALVASLASARDMNPSTYLVMLIHAHVRRIQLLAPAEVGGLKQAVSALGAIARQLPTAPISSTVEVEALLRSTEARVAALRQDIASLVQRQLVLWEVDDE